MLDSRGLDYASVRALREDIVMVRMPAWGSSGRWRDQPDFTYTANAASGLSWSTGYPDDEPLLTGTIVDPIAAMVATLAAIQNQRRTGSGALVEIPLCDVALQLSARSIIEASAGWRRDRATGDKAGRPRQFARNFQFFGAPVGLFCYVDRQTGSAQWSDLGMYLQTVMLLLEAEGLDSCPQESWSVYHRTVAENLRPSAESVLFCGMSIGYPDPDRPSAAPRTERAGLGEVSTFSGWES